MTLNEDIVSHIHILCGIHRRLMNKIFQFFSFYLHLIWVQCVHSVTLNKERKKLLKYKHTPCDFFKYTHICLFVKIKLNKKMKFFWQSQTYMQIKRASNRKKIHIIYMTETEMQGFLFVVNRMIFYFGSRIAAKIKRPIIISTNI